MNGVSTATESRVGWIHLRASQLDEGPAWYLHLSEGPKNLSHHGYLLDEAMAFRLLHVLAKFMGDSYSAERLSRFVADSARRLETKHPVRHT